MLGTKPLPTRLVSLDAFRGFTIIGMLIVNNAYFPDYQFHYKWFPQYSFNFHQFRHAHWDEFPTFTDMIFPWFLFMVGVAIPYSKASRLKRGDTLGSYFLNVIKRSLVLVFLGCVIYTTVNRRITAGLGGVLQPIGLAYCIAAFLYELPFVIRLLLPPVLLAGYWALLKYYPVPGAAPGVFTENENWVAYVNHTILWPPIAGLPSGIPTSALVLIGTFIGDLLRTPTESGSNKLRYMLFIGSVLALGGLGLHKIMPMEKEIWTPSYILFTGGLGCILLGLFYGIIDIKGHQKWAFFFVVYGMNAIAAYFISIMVREHAFQEWHTVKDGPTLREAFTHWCEGIGGQTGGQIIFITSYILFWWVVLYWMYRKRLFWRV